MTLTLLEFRGRSNRTILQFQALFPSCAVFRDGTRLQPVVEIERLARTHSRTSVVARPRSKDNPRPVYVFIDPDRGERAAHGGVVGIAGGLRRRRWSRGAPREGGSYGEESPERLSVVQSWLSPQVGRIPDGRVRTWVLARKNTMWYPVRRSRGAVFWSAASRRGSARIPRSSCILKKKRSQL